MDIVFARETFITGHVTVVAGSHWSADDPVVVSHPSLFTDDVTYGMSTSTGTLPPRPRAAEQATAGPGERRTRTRGE